MLLIILGILLVLFLVGGFALNHLILILAVLALIALVVSYSRGRGAGL